VVRPLRGGPHARVGADTIRCGSARLGFVRCAVTESGTRLADRQCVGVWLALGGGGVVPRACLRLGMERRYAAVNFVKNGVAVRENFRGRKRYTTRNLTRLFRRS
jgi:hypothetical protein